LRDTKGVDKQEELVGYVTDIVQMALLGRDNSGIIGRAEKFDRYWVGRHQIKNRTIAMGNKVFNKFAEILENRVAHLVDNRPKWVFSPQEENDVYTAKALNQILGDVIWDMADWDSKGESAVLEAVATGSCIIKCGIDNQGWPTFEPLPMEAVAVDPKAVRHGELRFIVIFSSQPTEVVKDRYGVKVLPEIKQTLSTDDKGTLEAPHKTFEKRSGTNNVQNVWQNLQARLDKGKSVPDVLGKAVVAEVWMTDYTMEAIPFDEAEIEQEHTGLAQGRELAVQPDDHNPKHIAAHEDYIAQLDPDIDRDIIAALQTHIDEHRAAPQVTSRRKYPLGRVVSISQGKLLRDQANPFPVHWQDLFVKFDAIKQRNSYYGKSLAHDLYDPMDDYNHRRNSITKSIDLCNFGVRKIRKGLYNEQEIRNLTNLAGQNVPVNDPSDFTVDFGEPLPQAYFQDLIASEQIMEKLAGHTEVLAGNFPKGSPPGVTVDQLLQQGSARLRLIIKHYAEALKKMARVGMAMMNEFIPPEVTFQIMGADNKPDKINWGDIAANANIFNIRVDIRSLTSSSRQHDRDQAIRLAEMGVYDREAVLDTLDDPRKYEVIERVSEIKQLQQIVQQQQAIIQQQSKVINTAQNRGQSSSGAGNVGN
jgi:hypothetical protein